MGSGSGIYERTVTNRESLSEAMMGNKNGEGNLGGTHPVSRKTREKLRKAMMGNHNFQNGTGFLGKHHTKKTKEKLRLASLGNSYAVGSKSVLGLRWKHSEKTKKKMKKSALKRVHTYLQKKSKTFPELLMENIINDLIKRKLLNGYLDQFPIRRYVVDFIIPERKLIIEVYGENWHSGFKKKIYDMRRKEILESLGYTVKIFWAKELLNIKKLNLKSQIEKRLLN